MSMDILRRIAAGNYHQYGSKQRGLRALHLGAATLMPALLDDVYRLVDGYPHSTVTVGHITGWTNPTGEVRQWSLFNRHGKTNDTSDDFTYAGIARKRPVKLPAIQELVAGLPDLVNLRLNWMGSGAALSPHEEHLPRRIGTDKVALRARFHLPIFTNPDALMLADDRLFHFEAGRCYFFCNGSVHGAENGGQEPRAHLVWDQLMTERAARTMFGDAPPAWLDQDVKPMRAARTVEITDWAPSDGMSLEGFESRELVYHPVQ